jgi:hypothetical protein
MSGTRRTTRSESGRQLRKPTPAACCANWDRGAKGPRRGSQEFRRVVARRNETRLGGAGGPVGRIRDEAAEHNGRAVDRARKLIIRGLSGLRGGVGAVLLREQEVERDRGRAGVFELVDELREALARPWPLAELLERFLVDLNDADRPVECVRTGLPALVLVENKVLHHGACGGANDAGQHASRQAAVVVAA